MLGFQFNETLSGTYVHDGDELPIRFDVRVHAASMLRHLRDRRATIEGFVDAQGLADHAVVAGADHMGGARFATPSAASINTTESGYPNKWQERKRAQTMPACYVTTVSPSRC